MAGDAIAQAYVEVGLRDSGLRQGMANVRQEMTGLQTAAGRLVPGIGVLNDAIRLGLAGGTVLAGVQIGRMAFEMAQAGAQAERLRSSFATVWGELGEDAETALARLRQASRNTISDTDLMLAANRAAMLGVAANTEQLAQLMEIAAFRGRAMGLSMTQAFDNIVTGLGRMSPLILDNLGITVDLETVTEDYARQLGRTAESLTETEQKQALVNAVLRDGQRQIREAGGIAEDSADQFDQLRVAIDRLRRQKAIELSEIIAPQAGGLAHELNLVSVTNEQLVAGTKSWHEYLEAYRAVREEIRRSALATALTPFLSLGEELDLEAWLQLRINIGDVGGELLTANSALDNFIAGKASEISDITGEVVGLSDALAELTSVTQVTLAQLGSRLAGDYGSIVGQLTDAIAQGLISEEEGRTWAQSFLAGANATLQQAATEGGALDLFDVELQAARDQELIDGRIEAIREEQRERERATRQAVSDQERAAREAASAWDQEMNRIRGVVESVIRPTFTGDPTNLLDQMGLHIDTADEDARRLASVMAEGLSSEWTQYFANRGLLNPDDLLSDEAVRARAATILREFQLGLRPDLIDKETAKQRVKELLLGQARTEQLVSEIMAELGAEGVQASRQQVRLALGDTSAAATGGVAGTVTQTVQTNVVALNLAPPTTQQLEQWRIDATGVQFDAFPFLVPPSEDNARYWRESLALGIQFNAWPYLEPPSTQDSDQWRANVAGIMFNATPHLAGLTVDEKLGWRTGAEGIQFDAAPVLGAPSVAQKLYWRAAAEVLTFDAAPLLWAPLEAEKDTWRANATGITFDAAPHLSGLTADEKQGWRNDLVSALTDGLSITGPLSLAIATDMATNGDATLGLDAREYGSIFGGYFVEGMGNVAYVSPLAEAITNDFAANTEPLAVIARAVGQFVGVTISNEIKKNTNVVQGVVDAAIEQMTAGLLEQAQGAP